MPKDIAPLLQTAVNLHAKSQGNFDPGLGELTALWGFKEAAEPGSTHNPPLPTQVMGLLNQGVGLKHLHLVSGPKGALLARADTPTLTLDFGAIAKGYAADQVVAQLKQAGIRSAIVNLGGNLRVFGDKGDRPWRIGIRAPRGEGAMAAIRNRSDLSVITSGDYERYFVYQGQRYHHIMNPSTGAPARGLISVTVVTDNAALGDAASTALFVAGADKWPMVARSLGVDKVMVVKENGQILVTPALRAFIEMSPKVEADVQPLPPA